MKAMQVNSPASDPTLFPVEVPQPIPGDGEVLIRVYAAGVTPTELLWYPTSHTRTGEPRVGAIPGHEFSGAISAFGKDVQAFHVEQPVFGMNDWFSEGATAEFCLTRPENITAKPASLTHESAATVPIGALTAWQGLFERAKLQPGERVLVQGGAGAVGLFVVQLAHLHGAYVIATASQHSIEFLQQLGADEVFDYQGAPFEDKLEKVDVVFDCVGGETLERSWGVLKPSGRLVTIAAQSEGREDQRVKDAFFIVEPNSKQLAMIAEWIEEKKLETFVGAIVPLKLASDAYRGAIKSNGGHGKIVVSVIPVSGTTN
ncbi:NADP-dependent oxidoreductase [Terriglobus saanensis]|uniref:Alcohol dehydrogenase zinc-binding domain protein n=1 Tax=Terriglobus saanensis (strain ATCC BAA-1853 / DSM 23119 / SP1PR4) TaxID=401053 RepID=E8V8H3_TERSS|nr:NADP-dependent oxidoreductase [Terriglobus saanensis]ADV82952.1 Alcohol dehydrogenase zinc-binding domain protein [Terriglobus saanensis SP1PR4]